MKTKQTFLAVASVALVSLAAPHANSALLLSQYGILDLTANGGINPNTGVAWQAGDQYRLAFHTAETIGRTSNDPSFYDSFATAQAQQNPALAGSTGWTAMVWVNTDFNQPQGAALSSPVVRSGTGVFTGGSGQGGAGVPVFAMDGMTAIARNNNDIYDSWSNPFETTFGAPGDPNIVDPTGNGNNVRRINTGNINSSPHYSPFLNQFGAGDSGAVHGANVWTGGFGSHVNALGDTIDNTSSSWGSSNANRTGRVWNRFTGNTTDVQRVYAISDLLTITAIPEPSSAALLGLGGLFLLGRRRRKACK